MDINKTLQEREKTYGSFESFSEISQALKNTLRASDGHANLTNAQVESLDMIMHKAARILNGSPDHIDSWHDIAGYAQLVVDILEEQAKND